MTLYIGKTVSPRHGFVFDKIPTRHGSKHADYGQLIAHHQDQYGPILDCVFEMADMIATSNGVSHEKAIETVLADEGWRILPTHRKSILERLKAA